MTPSLADEDIQSVPSTDTMSVLQKQAVLHTTEGSGKQIPAPREYSNEGTGVCIDDHGKLMDYCIHYGYDSKSCQHACDMKAACAGFSVVPEDDDKCFVWGPNDLQDSDFGNRLTTWRCYPGSGATEVTRATGNEYENTECMRKKELTE